MLKKHGLKVSSLYISQIKQKCGLALGQSYNFLKKKDAISQCSSEKEKVIMEALRFFRMI